VLDAAVIGGAPRHAHVAPSVLHVVAPCSGCCRSCPSAAPIDPRRSFRAACRGPQQRLSVMPSATLTEMLQVVYPASHPQCSLFHFYIPSPLERLSVVPRVAPLLLLLLCCMSCVVPSSGWSCSAPQLFDMPIIIWLLRLHVVFARTDGLN
jgi:hypothetical protein